VVNPCQGRGGGRAHVVNHAAGPSGPPEPDRARSAAVAYGLTSGIVTADIAVARRFWQGSRTGTVKVNSPLTGVPFHVPFEGYGHSGAGWAEGGESSLDFFTRTKTVYLRS